MISNLFPGVLTPFSPHLAYFTKSGGAGLADNYVPGQTVAEMFNIPTTFPVYLTVVIPSNVLLYDSYGVHQEAGHYSYDFARADVPGALRLDDLHPDSVCLIINHGEISGAGGSGGMGYQGFHYVSGEDVAYISVGSGGGGGRGYAGTKGGAPGYGGTFPWYAWLRIGDPSYPTWANESDIPDPYTAVAGADGDEDGPGTAGGAVDAWDYVAVPGNWPSSGSDFRQHAANLAAFDAGLDDWPNMPLHRNDFRHEGSDGSNFAWFLRYDTFYAKETATAACPYIDSWKNQYVGEYLPEHTEIPGYDITNQALFEPQPGTAAIVLGCETFIYNSESAGAVGYIFGGGGGGVGGDREAGTGHGFDGGDWGEQGEGPNWNGWDGGLGGKAVHKDGNDLTWLAGYDVGVQVKGDVT